MYPYKVLIVDDDEDAGRASEISLELFVSRENIVRVHSIAEAKQSLQTQEFDLAILDISLKFENGFELAEYIREQYPGLPYIFATGYTQYALDGYKFQPLDFLVKPFSAVELKAVLDKLEPRKPDSRSAGARIGVPFNGGFHVLDVEKVLYVEKSGRNIIIHVEDGQSILPKFPMEKMEKILEDHSFVRIHKSFLVATWAIKGVCAAPFGNAHEITLKGCDHTLPISRSHYARIKALLTEQGVRFIE